MEKYDVVIVGAGPAGSTAAFYLKNKKVLIIDKYNFPRFKACGGVLLNSKDWSKKLLNYAKIEKKINKQKTDSVNIYWNRKKCIENKTNHLWDQIDRKQFDHLLLKEALKKKNISFRKFHLKSITKNNNHYKLSDNKNSIETKYILGADGCSSIVSKFLGNKNRQPMEQAISIEKEIHCKKKSLTNHAFYYFNKEIGYAWLFPTPSGYYIGIGIIGTTNKSLTSHLNDLIKYCNENNLIPSNYKTIKTFGGLIPVTISNITCSDTIILCGDALGLVNEMTGDGIYYAMLSGKIAGQTLSLKNPNITNSYNKLIKPLIKETTIIKHSPAKPIAKIIFFLIFGFSINPPLPLFLKSIIQKKFINIVSRRNNLPEKSYYSKFQ